MQHETLYNEAINLLKQLISTPSFSKEEDKTAALIESFLLSKNIKTFRCLNNVWCLNENFDASKTSILLNSHHDTVKPNSTYTKNPFEPVIENEKLFGLGSNDAGASLVSLLSTFIYFFSRKNLNHNLVFAATAEEEISGKKGIEMLLNNETFIKKTGFSKTPFRAAATSFAIVGEPTNLNLAIAEKGLLVLDCRAVGKAGHAARNEGDNAIYKAMQDIEWIKNFSFEKKSEWLGEMKMSVTSIETENKQHNIVPSECKFVVDVRVTDVYSHEEILETIKSNLQSEVSARSLRLHSTKINADHPVVKAGIELGKKLYGSPTLSDKALIPFPALKCGPGDSARSHIADEFIYLDEIKNGIDFYIELLKKILC